jgi:glyoxylase-like metal-dependent hydrolase (beta-lactamase superfamily II)
MKMHLLPCGRVRMRKNIFLPAAERGETIELPVSSALLRHGQGNVLFDTGCHPAVPEDPEGRWGGLAKLMVPIMQPGEHVLTGLAGLGLGPDDIDVVINSHLHPDHCGCNGFFRKATFLVHAEELAARARSEASGYLAADWTAHAGRRDRGQRDVRHGRIVSAMPGHTPGSIGALAQLDRSGTFLLAGDTVSLRETLDTGIIPRNTWNADALAKSLDEVRRIESSGATILCSHDAKQCGVCVSVARRRRWLRAKRS